MFHSLVNICLESLEEIINISCKYLESGPSTNKLILFFVSYLIFFVYKINCWSFENSLFLDGNYCGFCFLIVFFFCGNCWLAIIYNLKIYSINLLNDVFRIFNGLCYMSLKVCVRVFLLSINYLYIRELFVRSWNHSHHKTWI